MKQYYVIVGNKKIIIEKDQVHNHGFTNSEGKMFLPFTGHEILNEETKTKNKMTGVK